MMVFISDGAKVLLKHLFYTVLLKDVSSCTFRTIVIFLFYASEHLPNSF